MQDGPHLPENADGIYYWVERESTPFWIFGFDWNGYVWSYCVFVFLDGKILKLIIRRLEHVTP